MNTNLFAVIALATTLATPAIAQDYADILVTGTRSPSLFSIGNSASSLVSVVQVADRNYSSREDADGRGESLRPVRTCVQEMDKVEEALKNAHASGKKVVMVGENHDGLFKTALESILPQGAGACLAIEAPYFEAISHNFNITSLITKAEVQGIPVHYIDQVVLDIGSESMAASGEIDVALYEEAITSVSGANRRDQGMMNELGKLANECSSIVSVNGIKHAVDTRAGRVTLTQLLGNNVAVVDLTKAEAACTN